MKWKTIPSVPLYECTRQGEMRRKTTVVKFGNQRRMAGGKILLPKTKANGYLEVNLSHKSKYVHRLVAETWIGDIPSKFTVNHRDGDKSNNKVSNLEIVSQSENSRHAYRTGLKKPTRISGSKSVLAKTNEIEVLNIRTEHRNNRSIKELTKKFPHLSRGAITKIVYRRTWKHI